MAGKNPRGGLWKVSVDAPIETDSTEIHDACAVIESTGAEWPPPETIATITKMEKRH